MYRLKVADTEYQTLAKELIKHGEATKETLETFLGAMRGVRQVGIEDGALAERMDIFITHVEMCVQKPGMYAEELAAKLLCYTASIDEADRSLY